MSAKKSKRLKLEDRVAILRRLETGELSTNLAVEYGITMSAISHMKKNKNSILTQKQLMDEIPGNPERKRFTGIENSPLDRCLYDWYMQKQSDGDPPSGPSLQEQALIFNKLLNGPETFRASSGFVAKFKKRYDIRSLSSEDEMQSPKMMASDQFGRRFCQYLEDHDCGMDQVYNAHATHLLWKTLPMRTSVIKAEPADEFYHSNSQSTVESRVTVMACTNASGTHKLPLFVMGNSNQPRCLKNIRMLPVVYRGKPHGWIDPHFTLDWYREVFVPEIMKRHRYRGEKCILLLVNSPGRPPPEAFSSISDICTVTYLPPNVTNLIQPISRGIIERLKKVYKKNLLYLLLAEDSIHDIEQLLGSLTMLHCCNFLSSSWNEITEINIRNSWRDIFPCDSGPLFEDVNLEPEDFLRIIQQLPEYAAMTLNEINLWLHQDDVDHEERIPSHDNFSNDHYRNEEIAAVKDEEEDKEHEPLAKKALRGVDSLIAWYQTRWECSSENLEFLEKLRSLAISEIVSNKI